MTKQTMTLAEAETTYNMLPPRRFNVGDPVSITVPPLPLRRSRIKQIAFLPDAYARYLHDMWLYECEDGTSFAEGHFGAGDPPRVVLDAEETS